MKSDTPSPYWRAHNRVKAQRGPASGYDCICGEQAREWALRPHDECIGSLHVQNVDGSPMWFSTCTADYRPMCSADHRAADAAERQAFEDSLDPQPNPYRDMEDI